MQETSRLGKCRPLTCAVSYSLLFKKPRCAAHGRVVALADLVGQARLRSTIAETVENDSLRCLEDSFDR